MQAKAFHLPQLAKGPPAGGKKIDHTSLNFVGPA